MTRKTSASAPRRLPAPAPSSPAGASPPAPSDDDEDFGFAPPDYDASEYRWVPVRRRPRYDGWTEEKQRRLIEVLADTGLVGAACKEVGMTRASAYRLRRDWTRVTGSVTYAPGFSSIVFSSRSK